METEHYVAAVVALLGIANATLGWLYAKRHGLDEARRQLTATHRELITSMEGRFAEQERVHRQMLEDVERRLEACEKRWVRWSKGPVG